MSVKYVGEVYFDVGEKIHIRSEVKPVCEQDIPFSIRNARWELYDSEGELEATGPCVISGHELDALVQPKKSERYQFKYIYEIADETWIDVVRLKVN